MYEPVHRIISSVLLRTEQSNREELSSFQLRRSSKLAFYMVSYISLEWSHLVYNLNLLEE